MNFTLATIQEFHRRMAIATPRLFRAACSTAAKRRVLDGTNLHQANMNMPADEAPYLPLLIGGLAAVLLAICGIAAVQAWMPDAASAAGTVFGPDEFPLPPIGLSGAQAPISPGLAEEEARIEVKCPECGVVASTREIGQFGAGIDPGAAGGPARDARNAPGVKSARRYEVTVRMKDGSRRVFMDAGSAHWRPGERVILIEGISQAND